MYATSGCAADKPEEERVDGEDGFVVLDERGGSVVNVRIGSVDAMLPQALPRRPGRLPIGTVKLIAPGVSGDNPPSDSIAHH